MVQKSKFVVNLEYYAVRSLFGVMQILPECLLYPFARGLFRLFYYVDGKHRKRAIRHILHSGIVTNEQDAIALAKRNFNHIANMFVDVAISETFAKKADIDSLCYMDGDPELVNYICTKDAEGRHRQCIVATAHYGNWEVAGNFYVWMSHRPMISVMRPLDNPKLGKYLYEVRQSSDHHVCPKEGALRHLMRAVKEGKNICLVVDQFAQPHESVSVTCFGRPVSVNTSLAKLHLKTGLPIFVGGCRRVDDKHHFVFDAATRIEYTPTDDPEKDIRVVTQMYMDGVEKLVRLAPEQWLWSHRIFTDLRMKDAQEKELRKAQKK